MKVTDIKQQIKRKDRCSIFIDGKYSFALSESGLLASGLKIGLELSNDDLEIQKQASVEDKGIYRVLDLISRRPRSEGEIKDYLKRKKYSDEEIEKILNALSIKGYIDDQNFARRWVENRRLLKPISTRKLWVELKQKKVSEEIIQQVLQNDETDEISVIEELINTKSRQTRYQDKQKLLQFLVRQGFNYGDIKQAFSNIDSAESDI
ncbi:MAG TPA: RecX family transcriptional regulator [Patescibacteria group bacterium]|nr:RecX family transcriptional regulator [Patescibacteria group bacterium]